jgi:flagellar biosynthesis protein FliR
MSFEGLSREAAVLTLELIRTSGLVAATPLLFSAAPARVRGAIALLLAFVAHAGGVPTARAVESFEGIAMAAPCELLVGVAMGMVVRFVLAIAEIMGDVVSPVIGLGAATLFDPHSATQETGTTRLFRTMFLLLALLTGVHRVVIAALIRSFQVVPVGAVVDPSLATLELVRLAAATMAAGVRLAVPILAVLMIVQAGLAFLSRAAPTLQLFSIGFGVTLLAGGLVIFTSLPDLAHEFERELSHVGGRIEAVLSAMVT